ncbi:MAG: hypothetical protein ABIU11_02180 [Chitinophagaceae bacterium]
MTASQKASINAILLGTGGALIGAIISSVSKRKFIIDSKKEKLRDLQKELMLRLTTN